MKVFLLVLLFAQFSMAAKDQLIVLKSGLELKALDTKGAVKEWSVSDKIKTHPDGAPFAKSSGKIIHIPSLSVFFEMELQDFAFLPNGGMIGIQGEFLGYIEEKRFKKVVKLPAKEMKLTVWDDKNILLYGGSSQRSVYLYNQGGVFQKLLESAQPIVDLKVRGGRYYLTTDQGVFAAALNEKPKPVFMLLSGKIQSIAFVKALPGFFFSTKDEVAYSNKGKVLPLVSGVDCKIEGGALLYTLCAKRNALYIAKLKPEAWPKGFRKKPVKRKKSKWKK